MKNNLFEFELLKDGCLNQLFIRIKKLSRQMLYFVLFKSMWNRKIARSIHLLSEINGMLSMTDQTKKRHRQVEIVGDFFLWRLKKYDDEEWMVLANENRRCLMQHFNIQVDENYKKVANEKDLKRISRMECESLDEFLWKESLNEIRESRWFAFGILLILELAYIAATAYWDMEYREGLAFAVGALVVFCVANMNCKMEEELESKLKTIYRPKLEKYANKRLKLLQVAMESAKLKEEFMVPVDGKKKVVAL